MPPAEYSTSPIGDSRPPSQSVAEPCGSRSTTSTRRPCSAKAAARLTVVVVLQLPPLLFDRAIVRTSASLSTRRMRPSKNSSATRVTFEDVSQQRVRAPSHPAAANAAPRLRPRGTLQPDVAGRSSGGGIGRASPRRQARGSHRFRDRFRRLARASLRRAPERRGDPRSSFSAAWYACRAAASNSAASTVPSPSRDRGSRRARTSPGQRARPAALPGSAWLAPDGRVEVGGLTRRLLRRGGLVALARLQL